MKGFLIVAFLTAGVLFIRSLGGLSKQSTARQGTGYGFMGMPLAAIVVTSVQWTVYARRARGSHARASRFSGRRWPSSAASSAASWPGASR